MTGSGTQGDPFIISSKADLQAIEDNLGSYYELGSNIDASGTGAGFTPISDFTGQLDGKGYTITGFFINRTGSAKQAFFGQISGSAVLNDIKMTGVDVTSDRTNTAGLVAYVLGSSCTITDCNTTGTVEGSGANYNVVGGLIGSLEGGTVSNCYSTCSVTCGRHYGGGLIGYMFDGDIDKCYATGNVIVGGGNGGGFVSVSEAGTIDDCYARGNVTVTGSRAAGFISFNAAPITGCIIDDCYSTGSVTTGTNPGGFCALNASTITNCFWDTETSGQASSDGGTGKTTTQMKTGATFTDAGWDFVAIWGIDSATNNGYPSFTLTIIFPTDAITRVTSLTHRYDRGTYTLELNLGEVVSDFGLPEWDSKPKKAVPEEPVIPDIVEPVAPAVSVPQPVELTPYAKKVIKENKAAMEILQLRTKARELGVSEPSARTIEIFMKEPEKIAILQEIGRMSQSARDPGITPYARSVFEKAIKRKQAELEALYNQ